MACITGLAHASEIRILVARGWDLRDSQDRQLSAGDVKPGDPAIEVRVYVDNDVFRIMDGDSWDKASPAFRADTALAELKRLWRKEVLEDTCDVDFSKFATQHYINPDHRIVGPQESCGKTPGFHAKWQALMHDLERFLSLAHVPESGLPRYTVAPLAEAIKTKVTELELMLVSYKQEVKNDAVDNHEGLAGESESGARN